MMEQQKLHGSKKNKKKRQCQVLRRHRFARDLRFGFICRGHLTRRTFQGGAGGGRGSGLCFRFGFRLGVAGIYQIEHTVSELELINWIWI